MVVKKTAAKKSVVKKSTTKKQVVVPNRLRENKIWQTQSNLDTLQRADQIKKSPTLMKDVGLLANTLQKVVKDVKGE